MSSLFKTFKTRNFFWPSKFCFTLLRILNALPTPYRQQSSKTSASPIRTFVGETHLCFNLSNSSWSHTATTTYLHPPSSRTFDRQQPPSCTTTKTSPRSLPALIILPTPTNAVPMRPQPKGRCNRDDSVHPALACPLVRRHQNFLSGN